jgi:hypothetical protein
VTYRQLEKLKDITWGLASLLKPGGALVVIISHPMEHTIVGNTQSPTQNAIREDAEEYMKNVIQVVQFRELQVFQLPITQFVDSDGTDVKFLVSRAMKPL